MKRCVLLLFFFLLASPAFAQNLTTVTASNIIDVSGAKLSSGALCFDASNATNSSSDTPSNEVSFQAGGGGQVLRGPICTPITTGAIGTFHVPNSANTIPAGVVYHIYVIQGSYHLLDYYQVSVTGTTWSFDTYNPNTPVGAVPSGASVNGPLTVNGDLAVTGSFTPGTLGNTSISGTLAVSGTSTMAGALTANGNGAAGNVPIKPASADAVQFVSAGGSDSNDGLSWGTAKATIPAALAALPSCSIGSDTWTHCGTVEVGAGVWTVSSSIAITSPFVTVRGRGNIATQIDYTGTTGCAFEWTSSPFNSGYGQQPDGGLFNLLINGTSAGTGTCGLNTYDLEGFRARGVSIENFDTTGGVGWLDSVASYFNERFDVSVTLANNTVDWKTEGGNGQAGYTYTNTTFGYGDFHLWINTASSSQVGILMDNHSLFQNSTLFVVENMVSGSTALELTNNSQIQSSLVGLHFEGGATGISADSTSWIQALGYENEESMTDTFANTSTPSFIFGYVGTSAADGIGVEPTGMNGSTTFHIGAASDIQNRSALAIGIQSGNIVWPFTISEAGTQIFGVGKDGSIQFGGGPYGGDAYTATITHTTLTANQTYDLPKLGGTIALSGANGVSAGTISISAATTGSHTFSSAYTAAPNCSVTPTSNLGTTTYWISTLSTSTLTVTVSASSTVVFDFVCTPGAN